MSSVEQQIADLERRIKKIERYMLWSTIFEFLRLAIVIIPIVLAIIFLPPVIKKYSPIIAEVLAASQQLIQHLPKAR